MTTTRKTEDSINALRWAFGRMKTRLWPLVSFSVAFSFLESALLAPLVAGILRLALDSWGRCSIGNFEILAFVLSPVGLAGLALITTIQLATLHLRFAGLLAVLAGDGPGLWHALQVARRFPVLVKLDVLQAILYLLLAIPFVIAGAFAYVRLWGPHDLNRLVVTHPPEFWHGVIAVGGLALLYLAAAGGLYLRWLFSIPAVLFEDAADARTALRSSAERTRGRLRILAVAVLGALTVFAALTVAVTWSLGAVSGWILDHAGASPRLAISTTAVVLVADALVVACLGASAAVIFAGIVLACYRQAGGVASQPLALPNGRRWSRVALVLSGVATILAAASALRVLDDSRVSDSIEITAHRAGATVAPENTIAALHRAIADGAEWAEIDVQLTSDQQLAVIHDSDLVRVGGSALRITTSTMDQIRQVDVGSYFDPAFASERVPTLEECLAAAGTDIGLNIELKVNNSAEIPTLVDRVLNAVRQADAIGRSRICAQSFPALQRIRRLEPKVEIGSVTGAVIGDPSRMDVDFLMVEARLATRPLVDRAGLRDMEIHAWTVNDPDRLAALIDDGVSNVITDDVAAFRNRLNELRALDPLERLLLRARNGLVGR